MSGRRFWLLLAIIILFGRIFQGGILWPEEGLPLAAAQQIHAGSVLYRDVWFDKPPLLAWFYLAVYQIAGHNVYAWRIVGAFYVLAAVWVGYRFAQTLWDESAARWTAFFLAFFTSFYHHAATVPLAADLLLVLPHLATFYLAASGHPWAAGLCAGFAFHLNAKALFVIVAAVLVMRPVAPLLAGFALGAAAGFGGIALAGGWTGYVEQVWRWGAAYARAPFAGNPWVLGLQRTLNYLGFHSALVIGAIAFFVRGRKHARIGIWLAVSFAAVLLGGRFFPRYYFQILPPLALAAGAGWTLIPRRRVVFAALALSLAVPAIRFGRANLWLALRRPWEWRDVAIDADSRRAAVVVSRVSGPDDRIFVWGFRPEIYFYTRRLGASQFLESQPLTGVLADRHLERSDPFWPEQAARNRMHLARELAARPPAAIIDGLGPYNRSLAMWNYPELRPLLEHYGLVEDTAGSRVYSVLR